MIHTIKHTQSHIIIFSIMILASNDFDNNVIKIKQHVKPCFNQTSNILDVSNMLNMLE